MTSPDLPFVPGVSSLSQVGRGGFATVYAGYEQSFDRRVAVKVLHVGNLDPAAVRRFERECAAMGRMTGHPHVVTVYRSVVLDSGQPALVTEYCASGSLAQRLARSGPLPVDEVAVIGARIADALRAAHRLGIIHRDVTPANVLRRESGEPALADFGLSVRADLEASRGLDALSPQHAAPETLASGDYTQASDTYGLGSTLYTLLAGHPPFPRIDGEPVLAHIQRVVKGGAPSVTRGDVPAELSALLAAMLAPRPQDRPSDDDVVGRFEALTGVHTYSPPPQPPIWAPLPEPALAATTDPWSSRSGDTRAVDAPGDDLQTRLRSGATPPAAGFRRGHRIAVVTAATVAVIALAGGVAFAAGLLPRHGGAPGPRPSPTPLVTTTPPAPTPTTPSSTPASATTAPTTPAPTTTAPPATSDAPVSTATPVAPVPPGYRLLTGAGRIRVAVPVDWTVRAHYPIATNTQVSDPLDPGRLVRFGGDPLEGADLADKVATLARKAATRDGYQELQRRPVAFGGGTAWDWEFTYVKDGTAMHAYGRYWRVGATDYVVYAAAPEPSWAGVVPVLQVMVDTATPR